jgi:hypothetical protein
MDLKAAVLEQLQAYVAEVRTTLPIILLGDFNADFGKPTASSQLLEDFCLATRMCRGYNDAKPTWYSATGRTRCTLDHVLVRHKFRSSAAVCRTLPPPFSSDHHIVINDVGVKWKKKAPTAPAVATTLGARVASLAWESEARLLYDLRFANHWNSNYPSEWPVGSSLWYAAFMRSVAAAAECLEETEDRTRLPTSSYACTSAFAAVIPNATQRLDFAKLFDDAYHDDTCRLVSEFASDLRANPWKAWQSLKATGRLSEQSLAADLKPESFTEHFTNLWKTSPPPTRDVKMPPPPPEPPPLIDGNHFTLPELQAAIRSSANHKASGPDDLPIEVLRCPSVQAALLCMFNEMLDEPGDPPTELLRAHLTPLYKGKGDAGLAANYRPVVLLSQALKLINKMILLRIRTAIDPHLVYVQAAYRPSRCTIQQIIALQQLLHQTRQEKHGKLIALFIDFSRAFDSVSYSSLERTLLYWHVPTNIIQLILTVLRGQQLVPRFNGQSSATPIRPTSGVLQGDTLAPYLFDLVVDVILRRLPVEHGVRVGPIEGSTSRGSTSRPQDRRQRVLAALAYADDIVLLSRTVAGSQALLRELETAANEIGLQLNLGKGKTEVLRIGDVPGDIVTLTGKTIPETDSYKYLGSLVGGCWAADFARRRSLAWITARKFDPMWKAAIPPDLKRELFTALIVPLLCYSALSYPLSTVRCQAIMQGAYGKLLRYCTGVRLWSHHAGSWHRLHNEDAHGKLPCFKAQLWHILLRNFGHWIRDHFDRNTEHPVIDVFLTENISTATRKRGGKKIGPLDSLLNITGLNCFADVCDIACDRAKWKALAKRRVIEAQRDFTSASLRRRSETEERSNSIISSTQRVVITWLRRKPDKSEGA